MPTECVGRVDLKGSTLSGFNNHKSQAYAALRSYPSISTRPSIAQLLRDCVRALPPLSRTNIWRELSNLVPVRDSASKTEKISDQPNDHEAVDFLSRFWRHGDYVSRHTCILGVYFRGASTIGYCARESVPSPSTCKREDMKSLSEV